jgi:hypothetical protein
MVPADAVAVVMRELVVVVVVPFAESDQCSDNGVKASVAL